MQPLPALLLWFRVVQFWPYPLGLHHRHWRMIGSSEHDDVIKWKHSPHYWPFVRGIHRSLVISPRKGQWGGALMFSLICIWINGWVNNREAGDLRCHRAHYDVIVMRMWINGLYDLLRTDKTVTRQAQRKSIRPYWYFRKLLYFQIKSPFC